MPYSAYVLNEDSRALILDRFKPKFSRVIAHHVTVKFPSNEVPPPAKLSVVGYASNNGIECAVVSVNGTIKRPDGAIYHITLSLNEPYKPKDSNELLKNGFEPVEEFSIYAPGQVFN